MLHRLGPPVPLSREKFLGGLVACVVLNASGWWFHVPVALFSLLLGMLLLGEALWRHYKRTVGEIDGPLGRLLTRPDPGELRLGALGLVALVLPWLLETTWPR